MFVFWPVQFWNSVWIIENGCDTSTDDWELLTVQILAASPVQDGSSHVRPSSWVTGSSGSKCSPMKRDAPSRAVYAIRSLVWDVFSWADALCSEIQLAVLSQLLLYSLSGQYESFCHISTSYDGLEDNIKISQKRGTVMHTSLIKVNINVSCL